MKNKKYKMTLLDNEIQTINIVPYCNVEGHTICNCQCDDIILRRPRLVRTVRNVSMTFRDRLGDVINSSPAPVCFLEGHTAVTCSCNW